MRRSAKKGKPATDLGFSLPVRPRGTDDCCFRSFLIPSVLIPDPACCRTTQYLSSIDLTQLGQNTRLHIPALLPCCFGRVRHAGHIASRIVQKRNLNRSMFTASFSLVPTALGPTPIGSTWIPFPNGTFFRSQISSFRSGAWQPRGKAFRWATGQAEQ
jgi:hypothetical protein